MKWKKLDDTKASMRKSQFKQEFDYYKKEHRNPLIIKRGFIIRHFNPDKATTRYKARLQNNAKTRVLKALKYSAIRNCANQYQPYNSFNFRRISQDLHLHKPSNKAFKELKIVNDAYPKSLKRLKHIKSWHPNTNRVEKYHNKRQAIKNSMSGIEKIADHEQKENDKLEKQWNKVLQNDDINDKASNPEQLQYNKQAHQANKLLSKPTSRFAIRLTANVFTLGKKLSHKFHQEVKIRTSGDRNLQQYRFHHILGNMVRSPHYAMDESHAKMVHQIITGKYRGGYYADSKRFSFTKNTDPEAFTNNLVSHGIITPELQQDGLADLLGQLQKVYNQKYPEKPERDVYQNDQQTVNPKANFFDKKAHEIKRRLQNSSLGQKYGRYHNEVNQEYNKLYGNQYNRIMKERLNWIKTVYGKNPQTSKTSSSINSFKPQRNSTYRSSDNPVRMQHKNFTPVHNAMTNARDKLKLKFRKLGLQR